MDVATGAADARRLLDTAHAQASPYAAAILDGTLADGDACELARSIRQDGRFAHLRLLLLSTPAIPDEERARVCGFDATQEKPLMPGALVERLMRLMDDRAPAAAVWHEVARPEILLASDHADRRALTIRVLTQAGYRVDAVHGPEALVEAAGRRAFELVVMDLRQWATVDKEAAEGIRAVAGSAEQLPIVAMAAEASPEAEAALHAAGITGIVTGPIDPERLLAAIERALNGSSEPPLATERAGSDFSRNDPAGGDSGSVAAAG